MDGRFEPMSVDALRRLMTGVPRQARPGRPADHRQAPSRLSYAIAAVHADRRGLDWGWLDQDKSFHQG